MLFLQIIGVWLASALCGAAVFPLVYLACPRLRDRGFAVARIAGLAAVTFPAWLAASFGIAPFGTPLVIGSLLLVAVVSVLVARRRLGEIASFLVRNRGLAVTVEALGFVVFLLVLKILSFNPEIAPETERFMDYALLHRIDLSESFPPQDPWMSGRTMNYYYYGYILVAALHKLVPIALPVFFNLVLGLIYALFVMGAFGLGYNLTGKLSFGFLGGLLLMFVGNLYGFIQVAVPRQETFDALFRSGVTAPDYWDKLVWQFKNFGFFNGARVMVQTGADGTILDYPINEFPSFSLVYGDLHPYVITYMINIAVINLLLNLARGLGAGWRALGETIRERGCLLGLLAVLIGLLIGAHTWDYPVYLGTGTLILAWLSWRKKEPEAGEESPAPGGLRGKAAFIPPAAALAVLSFILYLPFNLPFLSEQAGKERGGLGSVGRQTPLDLFLVACGIFLFFTCCYLFARAVTGKRSLAPLGSTRSVFFLGAGLFVLLATGGLFLVPTWLLLALLAAAALALFFRRGLEADEGFALSCLLVALGLGIFCEFFFLIDHYQGGGYERMNTMFKLYTNIWLLLGSVSLFGIAWVAGHLRNRTGLAVWRIATGALIVGGLVYTVAAVGALARGHRLPETLDGLAYVEEPVPSWQKSEWRWDRDDLAAVRWIKANTDPDDIILQGVGNAYDWAPRIATFSGRPTLIGWTNHEAGWRNDWKEPQRRQNDAATVYSLDDPTRVRTILADYGVDYVYLGRLERERHPGGAARFPGFFGAPAYSSGGVDIYRVNKIK